MKKEQEVNAIYKSVHKDYKMTKNGKKYIMYFDDKLGSTRVKKNLKEL